jgi:hypothetical protein
MTEENRLEDLRARVEDLERVTYERSADNVYARCYSLLAAVLLTLSFVPYAEDSYTHDLWDIGKGWNKAASLGSFALLFFVGEVALLLWATIRPGRSPMLGWLIGFGGLVLGVLGWILAVAVRYPAHSSTTLVVSCFAATVVGGLHGAHLLRRRTASV